MAANTINLVTPMSAEKNLEVLDLVFDRFNETGEPPKDAMHDDIEWVPLRDDPDYKIHQGSEDVLQYLAEWGDSVEGLRAERLDQIVSGDMVLVWFRIGGRGRRGQVPVELEQGIVYSFRDGKIARGVEYSDRAQAELDAGTGG